MYVDAPLAQRLARIADSIAFATAAGATDERLEVLTPYLDEIRTTMGMDIAFVSQLQGDRRVFKVVSASAGLRTPVQVGESDPLLDTYCMYVVQGRLPPVIRDVHASRHEAALLPITERLGIGCYVSAPVILSNGEVFGTLCCFSTGVRLDLIEADGLALRAIGRAIATMLERTERGEH